MRRSRLYLSSCDAITPPLSAIPGRQFLGTENIQNLDAFNGLSISRDANGNIDPAQDLFRTDWPGVSSGPMVSQFMLADFDIDGIIVEPKQKTLIPDIDYMTGVDTWLDVQVEPRSVLDSSMLQLPCPENNVGRNGMLRGQ